MGKLFLFLEEEATSQPEARSRSLPRSCGLHSQELRVPGEERHLLSPPIPACPLLPPACRVHPQMPPQCRPDCKPRGQGHPPAQQQRPVPLAGPCLALPPPHPRPTAPAALLARFCHSFRLHLSISPSYERERIIFQLHTSNSTFHPVIPPALRTHRSWVMPAACRPPLLPGYPLHRPPQQGPCLTARVHSPPRSHHTSMLTAGHPLVRSPLFVLLAVAECLSLLEAVLSL